MKRDLRHRPRAWRPGLSRRRQSQRAGRAGAAGRASAPMSAISICTRPSASRMAAAGRAWGRSASRRISRRFLPAMRFGRQPAAARRRHRAGVGGAVRAARRSCRSPGRISRMMGGDGLKRATEVAILNANYIARAARPHYPDRLYGAAAAMWRMNASSTAAAQGEDRRQRGGRRQAPDRLRLPRADHVVAGAGDADDRADRERGPSASSTGSARR